MTSSLLTANLYQPLHSITIDLEIELAKNQTLGILGSSGSGKSMTLRMIAGLVNPQRGHISLGDRVLLDTSRRLNSRPQERRIGYVFQHYALFPHMTVAENIAYGLPNHLKREKRQAILEELLTEIRLTEHANRYPSQLSGGQQQRVALARSLAAEPELLLLDEPFSALDAELRGELEALVLRFRQSRHIPYILVTHNLEEAYRLCDQLAIIDQGKIIQYGPKDQLLHNPSSTLAARKIGAKNLWPGQVISRTGSSGIVHLEQLGLELQIPHLPNETAIWVGIRPSEAVLLSGPDLQNPNTFPINVLHQIRGVQSHTLFVYPQATQATQIPQVPQTPQVLQTLHALQTPSTGASHSTQLDAGSPSDLIEIEVPGHRLKLNDPHLYLPPDKLFALPRT